MTDSVSLLSDAMEALVNLAAGLIALGALTIVERPADARHTYGHDKAEYFSSGAEGVLILVAAVSIIYTAADRFLPPTSLEHLGPGLLVALLAAVLNFVTARLMLRVARKHDSITIEADAKHLLTDVWTSSGVIAALLVVMVMPEWRILDPSIAVVVRIHIIWTGVDLLRRSMDGLMDAALSPREVQKAEELIRGELPSGTSFHAVKTRKAGSQCFIEFHMLVPGESTANESHVLCDRIEAAILDAGRDLRHRGLEAARVATVFIEVGW